MLTTFPAEWVAPSGLEDEGADEIALLQYLFALYGIEWALVPDPRATSYRDQGRKAYKLTGVPGEPLSTYQAFCHLSVAHGYIVPEWLVEELGLITCDLGTCDCPENEVAN